MASFYYSMFFSIGFFLTWVPVALLAMGEDSYYLPSAALKWIYVHALAGVFTSVLMVDFVNPTLLDSFVPSVRYAFLFAGGLVAIGSAATLFKRRLIYVLAE